MDTTKYKRKPIYIDAVRVTDENFFDVAQWCQGAIVSSEPGTRSLDELKRDKSKFIKVRVINPQRIRQTKAFIGDWVLYSEYSGYKVYTNGAFENSFEIVKSIDELVEAERYLEDRLAPKESVVNISDPSEKDERVLDGGPPAA
jgi:hypothetical protein